MIKTLIIFLIVCAGIIAGPLIVGEQGFALFQISGYRLKMSVVTFVILDMLLFLFLFIIYWVMSKLTNVNTVFNQFFNVIFGFNFLNRSQDAQLLLLEGNYKKASAVFKKQARKTHNRTLSYLQAAQAAINNYDIASAKTLLAEAALTCTKRDKLAFEIVQLRLLIRSKQGSLAVDRVNSLLRHYPKHPEILRLAYEIYSEQGEYQKVVDIMPLMSQLQVYPKPILEQYEKNVYLLLIRALSERSEPEALKKWWCKQPRMIRNDNIYQKEVAKQFNRLGQFNEAEKLHAIWLKQNMSN